jgi:two-component system NarL family response regulator
MAWRRSRTEEEGDAVRVLIVDDHPLFAEGLRNLLAERGIDVVGVAHDGHEALTRARALRPDVVLMDVQMPRLGGVDATRALKALVPEVTVLMLTQAADDDHLFAAIAAGASGYVLKSEPTDTFLRLLEGAARGEVAISATLAGRLLREFARLDALEPDGAAAVLLTDRQREVLRLVADGLLYKQVAGRIGVSERAVKYHMGEILVRLHVHDRAEAVAHARRLGLIP